ncbi:glutamate decarboxylase gad1 [Taxawa tesnikishii (nom. ined.)]|nr:glutamate decarboxylase gad1 [Dothideales sp. JES 119]
MLKGELDLDGRPNLNLDSFVGTYMEEQAEKLMVENLNKNMSDAPAMMNMHTRCVSIIANLWGAQKGEKPIGTATTGSSEGIHLGGFTAPFTHAKVGGPKWNFELPRVKPINTSGHKFGLVYAGVGWIIWKNESFLPKHLILELHYLGGTEESYTLNFSRPGAQVIAQYYNLIHLGYSGYQAIMENALANAHKTACTTTLREASPTPRITRQARTSNAGLPIVAFTLSDDFKKDFPHVKQVAVSNLMRAKQYIIPNYPLPPNEEQTEISRVVVHLCSVIVNIMQTSSEIDLSVWQPLESSAEKKHGSVGVEHKNRHKANRPMSQGVRRGVC